MFEQSVYFIFTIAMVIISNFSPTPPFTFLFISQIDIQYKFAFDCI